MAPDSRPVLPEAVTLAAVALHDAECPDKHCSGPALGAFYERARIALNAAAEANDRERQMASEPLRMDGTRCDSDIEIDDGDHDHEQCPTRSGFQVERSDHDPSYDAAGDRAPTEACEAHLADTVLGLIDGNDQVNAIVKVRWF